MTKMTDEELVSYLSDEARQAHLFNDGELQEERVKAMRAYTREPYGNEEEGRSAVVASDVFDAVEGMLPDLIEVFTSSEKAVVFEPVGPEDEEGAEQVTNACNYVFYKQNNGFLILYTALKDALLLKTGAVKWFHEKKRVPTFTRYSGVDEMQIALFMQDNPEAEIIEQEEAELSPEEAQQFQQMAAEQYQMTGLMPEMPRRFNVKVKTIQEEAYCCVVAIPPEELQVSRRHDSPLLKDCPYVCHVTRRSVSELREMGYTVEASELRAATYENVTDYRENNGGRFDDWEDEDPVDESMVRGYLRDEYVLVDYDGDGIAERRNIVRLGDRILANRECSHVPIAAWTPYIMTHAFSGMSVADLVEDFQRIHTTIMRQQLDNLYLANNQETIVTMDAQGNPMADIDSLLNRRPGGIIMEKGQGNVRPYQERWQGIEAMPMLEQLQGEKENRTGWTRYSQGLDGDSLNKTATGAQMIMNASQKRMKLMARIAAECLVAPMFQGIFKVLTDNGMEKLSYRLNGKYVQADPQEWRDQYDMTINVGIGTGDVQQQNVFLQQIAQTQAMVAQSPFAKSLMSPDKFFNVQARLAENAGFKNPEEFWVDPASVPPEADQPPPPDPKVVLEQEKLKNDQMKTQAEMQQKSVEADKDRQFKASEADKDRQFKLEMELMRLDHAAAHAHRNEEYPNGQ